MDSIYNYRYEEIIYTCNECQNDIYEGDEYYTFGTHNVCGDCINDHIRQAKKEGM